MSADLKPNPETANAIGVGFGEWLGSPAKRKLEHLTDRGAKITKVVVHFEMPNGDEGTLDSHGRCQWNPMQIEPRILTRELKKYDTDTNPSGRVGSYQKH